MLPPAKEAAMQARLKVLHDKANVKHVKLLPVTLIGRSTECNLKIASSQVSRNHCRITLGADSVFVEDLGSANGTLVDGQLLPAHQPTAIAPGSRLIVGPAEFQIDYVASTSATMVLARSGVPRQPELPVTEVISHSEVNSVVTQPAPAAQPAAPTAADVAFAAAETAAVGPIIAAIAAAPVVSAPQEAFSPPVPHSAPGDTVLLEPGISLGETEEAPASAGEETVFMFQETIPESVPFGNPTSTDPPGKKGGLKSLFSMFGRKEKSSAGSSPTPVAASPVASPSVFLPAVEPSAEVAEERVTAADTVEIEENSESKPAASDDGFDQFLSQF